MSVFSKLCNNIVDFGTSKSSPRTGKVCKCTPHHMAGNIPAGDCAKMHRDGSVSASANYYIGNDGFIVGGVSEDRRAWTTASSWNDNQAITTEVANCAGEPDWTISEAAYKSLVALYADICVRYNIDPHCDGSKNGTITYHQMFVATACPGPYLKRLIDNHTFENDIKAAMKKDQKKPSVSNILYRVQTGAYSKLGNAKIQLDKVKAAGFEAYVVKVGNLYKIQVGAFAKKSNAVAMSSKLTKAGFATFITTQSGIAVTASAPGKSAAEVAMEIFKGTGGWGNEPERSKKLKTAGYDPEEVQKEVNKLFKK